MQYPDILFETNDIIRISLSAEDGVILTCVFLVKENDEYTMIDCGLDEYTTEKQLIPALARLQIPFSSIKTLLITHIHFDHIGGFRYLYQHVPHAKIFAYNPFSNEINKLTDGMRFGCLQAVHLPGHTLDCFGFFDTRTRSLLSGDAVQLWGAGDYGVNAEAPQKYFESHEKLLSMPIENIFSSHYYDFLGMRALGRDKTIEYIKESENNYRTLIDYVKQQLPNCEDPQEICTLFAREHKGYPKMQAYSVEQIIKYYL